MSALDYISVRKAFPNTVALESFDLEVRDGELISLLGPSGCGKTTALRIGARFEFPDSGAVTVDGQDITRTPAHKRNMGMVFQSYSLFPNLNVEANVAFGLRVRKVAGADRVPAPTLPSGLRLTGQEGAGEVQTPLRGSAAGGLAIGDRVYFRHAKAGELCERFASLLLVEGDAVVDEVTTYRGDGHAFL